MGEFDDDLNLEELENSLQDNSYVFIKMVVASTRSNYFGVVMMKINYDSHTLETIEAAISGFSHFTSTITIDSSWADFQDFITSKKMTGETQEALGKDIQTNLRTLIEPAFEDSRISGELIAHHEQGATVNIIEEFLPTIGRILNDRNIKITCGTQFVLQEEIDSHNSVSQEEQSSDSGEPALPKEDTFFDAGPDAIVLDCGPVVAPVSGVPIFNVREGSEVMVRILNNSVQGNKFNSLFNLITEDGKILAKRGLVTRAKMDDGGYKFLIHLENNVYGKLIETEQIKIKPYVEEEVKRSSADMLGKVFTVIALAGILILFAFIYIFFLG